MKRNIAISLLLILAVAGVALAKQGAWTGVVSDVKCGAKKHDAACVTKCMSGGQNAALVVGKNVYTITNGDTVKGHEGHKVKVTGNLDAAKKEITVAKLEMVAAAKPAAKKQ
jgi:hypothetical protein